MGINSISNLNMNINNNIEASKINNETKSFKEALEQAKQSEDNEKLSSTCKQFESIFVNILLKNMRRTVMDSELVTKSYAREMFEGMLDEKIAEEVSKGQGMGLSQIMYQQLSKKIESEEG